MNIYSHTKSQDREYIHIIYWWKCVCAHTIRQRIVAAVIFTLWRPKNKLELAHKCNHFLAPSVSIEPLNLALTKQRLAGVECPAAPGYLNVVVVATYRPQ